MYPFGLHSGHIRLPANARSKLYQSNWYGHRASPIPASNALLVALTLFMSQWRRLQLPVTWQFPQALGVKRWRRREAPNENTWRPGNWWATKLRLWVMANAAPQHKQKEGARSSSTPVLRLRTPEGNPLATFAFQLTFRELCFPCLRPLPRSLCRFHDKIINQRWIR